MKVICTNSGPGPCVIMTFIRKFYFLTFPSHGLDGSVVKTAIFFHTKITYTQIERWKEPGFLDDFVEDSPEL